MVRCAFQCKEVGITGSSILLVDDNVSNQGIASVMLRNLGCSVRVASNGAEAIRAFETQEFDIVLMDVQMPEMDGLEAAGIIREKEGHRSTKPVIIIGQSAYSSGEHRRRCLASGMGDYLSKPLLKEALRTKLQECLAARGQCP